MKLLILFIALLVGTNPSFNMPVQSTTVEYDAKIVMDEILEQLKLLVKIFPSLKLKDTDINELGEKPITTPRDIKNACACGEMFKENLNKSVQWVASKLDSDYFFNIVDNLDVLTFQTPQTNDCHFKDHNITHPSNIKTFLLQDNIHFIQQWNTHNCNSCKS